jgi:prepilin-type processing-associated H-X9-DG protein
MWPSEEQDALGVVRDFVGALKAGAFERAASLMTPDSVLFMETATSIVPPPAMKEKPKPMFFDQELTEADVQALRGVVDALILSGAVQIEPGAPVSTEEGVKVPVIIQLKRDILVTRTGDALQVDLAAPYPAAREAIREMTQEGAESGEQAPQETPQAPQAPPGESSGGAGQAPGGSSGVGPQAGGVAGATAQAQEAARKATCLSNLKQLALAMLMFATDHQERLPNAEGWMSSLEPYLREGAMKSLLHCPSDKEHEYSYALNSGAAGRPLGEFDDPGNTVLLFESNSGRLNAADPVASLCDPPRHGNGNNFAYVDGHVAFVRKQ